MSAAALWVSLHLRRELSNCLTCQAPDSQHRPDLAIENLAPRGDVLLLYATTHPPAVTETSYHKSRCPAGGSFHPGTYAFTALSVEITGRWAVTSLAFPRGLCQGRQLSST